MATQVKNIIVGAAKVYVSYGTGTARPDASQAGIFPWNINVNTSSVGSNSTSASGQSTPAFFAGTASGYWRDLGFTSTGVDVSYEPGYSDVVVDQLLDAARLFQQSLKVVIKTELDEGSFENMNLVWGQQEVIVGAGSAANVTVNTLSQNNVALGTASAATVSTMNMAAGSLGIAPVERSLVFVGNAPGYIGSAAAYPSASTGVATITAANALDASNYRLKERVYIARRIIQEQTTAHALKRDAATVFPVSFRALPDDNSKYGGSEYGFIIDRVYGTS